MKANKFKNSLKIANTAVTTILWGDFGLRKGYKRYRQKLYRDRFVLWNWNSGVCVSKAIFCRLGDELKYIFQRACVGRGQADWAIYSLNSSILWLMVIDLTAYTLFFSCQRYKLQQLDYCQLLKSCSVDHLSLHFSSLYIAFFLLGSMCLR